MLSKECRVTRLHIDELELGERPSERATAHLSLCAACREFRADRSELRQLVGSLEPVVAPADFEMRMRARLAREESTQRQPIFARLLGTPALAAAALFVVVGGTAVWVAQRNDEPAQPATAQHQQQLAKTVVTSGPADEPSKPSEPADNVEVSKPAQITPTAFVKNRPRQRTADYSVQSAYPIGQTDQAFVPSKPAVIALEDERGTKRKISLPAVSFGAQNLVDNRTPVSYTGNSRVW